MKRFVILLGLLGIFGTQLGFRHEHHIAGAHVKSIKDTAFTHIMREVKEMPHTQMPLVKPNRTTVFTYKEPTIDVSLYYEVQKDTLKSRMKVYPHVPYTVMKLIPNQETFGEEIPPILQKAISCHNGRLAIAPHARCHMFKEFMQVINLKAAPIEDTLLAYTHRYMMRVVITQKKPYELAPHLMYYEIRMFNVADNRLVYILGFVENIGFTFAKCKVETYKGEFEMREWQLDKINGIPLAQYLASKPSFAYFDIWGAEHSN